MSGAKRPGPAEGYPPAEERTPLDCLRVVIDEEWDHHQVAIRDMARW